MKIFAILVFCITIQLSAQDHYDSLITVGINQIYSIKFDEAQATFNQFKIENPNHPAGLFFEAMIDWWEILIDLKNDSKDEIFYDKIEETIDFCEDILDDDPNNIDALFFKGGALGFRGRLLAIREDFFNAALDGKDALPLVYQVYDLDTTNVDAQLGFGIYNYYAAVIPEQFPFVKPLMIFFPEGDKNLGLKYLENVSINGKYAKIESEYFLEMLYFRYENNYQKAGLYANDLLMQFPNNPIFERYLGKIQIKQSSYPFAAKTWRSILDKCLERKPGYNLTRKREATYYLSMDYFYREKYDSAKSYLENSLELTKRVDEDEETGWLVNSTLFLGKINDVLLNRIEAVKYYELILDYEEYNGSYAKAKRYLENPYKSQN